MLYIIIGILVLIADIASKLWALEILRYKETIPILSNALHLTYVENTGIAFGMFGGGRVFFIVITFIVIFIMTYFLAKTPPYLRTVWQKSGYALITGGAIGNLIDRALRGFVVDFIDFRLIGFPVFNIADTAICIGAALLLIHYLFMTGDKHGGK